VVTRGNARLRLLMRPGCGLCEEMAADLLDLRVAFDAVDVEQDPALESAFGESIPVLFHDEREIARAPQTRSTLSNALMQAGLL
jgi:hypothetical protein